MSDPLIRKAAELQADLLKRIDEEGGKLGKVKQMAKLLNELGEDTKELDAIVDVTEKVIGDIKRRFKPIQKAIEAKPES